MKTLKRLILVFVFSSSFTQSALAQQKHKVAMHLCGNGTNCTNANVDEADLILYRNMGYQLGKCTKTSCFNGLAINAFLAFYAKPEANTSTILMNVSASTKVTISIYDHTGALIYTQESQSVEGGLMEMGVDVAAIASGIYILEMKFGDVAKTEKISIIK